MTSAIKIKLLISILAVLSGIAAVIYTQEQREQKRMERTVQYERDLQTYRQKDNAAVGPTSKSFHSFKMP